MSVSGFCVMAVCYPVIALDLATIIRTYGPWLFLAQFLRVSALPLTVARRFGISCSYGGLGRFAWLTLVSGLLRDRTRTLNDSFSFLVFPLVD